MHNSVRDSTGGREVSCSELLFDTEHSLSAASNAASADFTAQCYRCNSNRTSNIPCYVMRHLYELRHNLYCRCSHAEAISTVTSAFTICSALSSSSPRRAITAYSTLELEPALLLKALRLLKLAGERGKLAGGTVPDTAPGALLAWLAAVG